jgi:hypothetical protein
MHRIKLIKPLSFEIFEGSIVDVANLEHFIKLTFESIQDFEYFSIHDELSIIEIIKQSILKPRKISETIS